MPKIIGGSLAEHRDQVRERLFAAMSALLAERGYDSVSLADVAAAADVGRTAVYNHYPDKESVLLALIEHQTDRYLEHLRTALAAVSNPVDELAVFVRIQLSELAQDHVQLAGLGSALSERGRERIVAHVAPMTEILRGILQAGIDERYLPQQDAGALVALVSATTAGRTTAGLRGAALERAIDAAVLFVLRGAGARLGPGRRPRRLPSGRG